MQRDEKRAIVAWGIGIGGGVIWTGLKLGFPDMIVPFWWAMALTAFGFLILASVVWYSYVALVRAEPLVARDTHLYEGVAYAVTGLWEGPEDKLDPDYFEKFADMMEHFTQKARDGDLSVWGRPAQFMNSGAYEIIPAEAWSIGKVDFLDALGPDETRMTRRDNDLIMFADPMVSRVQFEKAWPSHNGFWEKLKSWSILRHFR